MEFVNDTNYLDQHFLVDKKVINAFIDACNLNVNENVIEIGPGKCVLSETIARRSKSLILIESDKRLEHFINVLMEKYNNADVIWNSALNVYFPPCDKIVSALPYSITEPFIEKLLRCSFNEGIFIVGNNFATNVAENKSNKLSLLTNCFFKFEKLLEITPDAFEPSPRVMSALIRIKRLKRNELINNPKMYIMREMFFRRGRKLKNNLMESLIELYKATGRKLTKKESKSIIDKFELDKDILNKEMEQLSNEDYELILSRLNIE